MDMNQNRQRQAKQGLYRPAYEHDACGVGLVVNVGGGKSHEIVKTDCRFWNTWPIAGPRVPIAKQAMEPE